MSWQDRDYASEYGSGGARYAGSYYRGSGMAVRDIVTTIIIANAIVYFLTFYTRNLGATIANWGVMQADAVLHGQVWRLFTATYMHANFMHIFFNMLMLYFFGPLLEHRWGSKQFFIVYSLGGIFGNIVLTFAGLVGFISPEIPGLGASGSVLTVLGAAAVLFPNTEVLVYFLFPLRLRTIVIVYGLYYVWNIVSKGANYGGDICHVGGLLVGIWWARSGGFAWAGGTGARDPSVSVRRKVKTFLTDWGGGSSSAKSGAGSFQRRVEQRAADATTVDQILAKVYEKGIHSLTPEEKRALTEASERLRAEEARMGRTDRL